RSGRRRNDAYGGQHRERRDRAADEGAARSTRQFLRWMDVHRDLLLGMRRHDCRPRAVSLRAASAALCETGHKWPGLILFREQPLIRTALAERRESAFGREV